MRIVEEDFIMEESQFAARLFDLQLLAPATKKDGSVAMEMKPAGYGMTVDRCVSLIINNRVNNKIDGDIALKTYFQAYVNESKAIGKQLQTLNR